MYSSCTIDTPLGALIAIASDTHLVMLEFADSKNREKKIQHFGSLIPSDTGESFLPAVAKIKWFSSHNISMKDNPILEKTKKELSEYFVWTRKIFDIPLIPEGTDFQKKAWQALQNIPYWETRSYKEEAIMIWNPKAVRAIGWANNKNPIVIIIPCHRVIGKNGSLVGYGGGLDRKIWLLEHEKQK